MAGRYRWDDFVLDLDAYRLERAGVTLSLEPKAFNLLLLMVQRPGHLFTKQEIFDAVWPGTAVTDHALTRVVAQLRRVLGDEAREAKYIETVPTRGYRWIRPLHQDPAESTAPSTNEGSATVASLPIVFTARVSPGSAAAVVLTAAVIALLTWTQRGALTLASPPPPHVREEGWTPEGLVTAKPLAPALARPYDVRWPVQMTTHAGLDLHPSLSPDGRALAYVSDRTGAFEIYVRAVKDVATDTPLTSDRAQNVQPAWSPDGTMVAYHSYKRGGIWVMPARGGVPRQIATEGSNPAWSPDGQRLAFQSDEHADVTPMAWGAQSGSTIWSVRADGSDLRQLTRTGQPIGGHAAPAWSPDSRSLAFTVFEGGSNNGVWILNLATNATTQLQRGAGLYELVFAPDNSALYVAGGEAVIVRLPFDPAKGMLRGEREEIPIAGVPGVRGLTISADGKSLAFAGFALSSQIWSQPVSRDGSALGPAKALTSDTSRRNSLPTVSPDGSRVAYVSTRSGGLPNVWMMDIDGRNGVQLTSDETADSQPQWFPDGHRVAFYSSRRRTPGLWSVDTRTRREELIFDVSRAGNRSPNTRPLVGRLAELALAPSMTRAAFSLIAPPRGRRILYITGVEPFSPRALGDDSQSIGYPAWSPDERFLAVEIKDGSSTHAGIVDVRTGAVRRLTNERGQTWVRTWSPDGRKLALATLRDGLWSLRWLDVSSGRQGLISPVSAVNVYVRYPDWSVRGDRVLFERGELRGNIWMLEISR